MQTNSIFYSDGDKKRARAEMSCARANIPHPDEYARVLCNAITQLSEYASADTVLMYFPTKSEPDLTFLALSALRDGKRLAFPISRPQDCTLDFREVRSLNELAAGAYGIYEPSESSARAFMSSNTICIVPALAIDRDGYRLGYGKGYYDRFLCDFEGVSIVPIHSSLVCERLPRNNTDIQVKIIVTETGVIRNK